MKKIINTILPVISAMILVSCSDWLNLEPEDGVIREEFWQTKEQVNSAVVGCYCSLQNGPVYNMFTWGELRADMLETGTNPSSDFVEMMNGDISASNGVTSWSSVYTTINNCNTVLKFAPDVRKIDGTFTESQLKAYESEALTIRALMYFYLVRTFRDVPLVLNASVSDDQKYAIPKTSGDVILDTLVQDLRNAEQYAPETYNTNASNKCRITRWAVKALLADILLWQEKYSECNEVCQEVIASGRYSMLPVEKQIVEIGDGGIVYDSVTVASESDADNVFIQTYVNGKSAESIFEIPFTTTKTNPFYSILSTSSNKLKPKLDVLDEGIFPAPQYQSVTEATDIRGNSFSYKGGLVWKYVGTSRSGAVRAAADYTSPWIVYKYSDVLLMKAEALDQLGIAETNDEKRNKYFSEAIECMNTVRSARNAVKTDLYKFTGDVDGKQLEKAILEERAREFSFEGKRWFDVLRFAKRNNYGGTNLQYLINLAIKSATPQKQQSLIAKYKDPKHNSHYLPINVDELETNKELVQNEFYAQ